MKHPWKIRPFEILVFSGMALSVVLLGIGMYSNALGTSRGKSCLSNLKQISLATMQYNRNYDELHPLANQWSAVLLPYSKSDAVFHCPSTLRFGYAMNTHLNGLNMARVTDPVTTPLFFDSAIHKRFQHDKGTSWPKDARHPLGNAVVFDDGHVKMLQQKPAFRSFEPALQKVKAKSTGKGKTRKIN